MTESLDIKNKSFTNPITLLPQSLTDQSSESIELYLNFLSNITSLFITLRQTIEQYQTEPFDLIKSIHKQCQQYYEHKIIEPILPTPTMKGILNYLKVRYCISFCLVLSPEEQRIIRLQAHWRRRLIERKLNRKRRAAQKIQARWRGYVVRQRMRTVRRLYSQQQQTYDEIDLAQFDFDEVNHYFHVIDRRFFYIFRMLLMHVFSDHAHLLLVLDRYGNLNIMSYQKRVP